MVMNIPDFNLEGRRQKEVLLVFSVLGKMALIVVVFNFGSEPHL